VLGAFRAGFSGHFSENFAGALLILWQWPSVTSRFFRHPETVNSSGNWDDEWTIKTCGAISRHPLPACSPGYARAADFDGYPAVPPK
jgi:hypothetical protein